MDVQVVWCYKTNDSVKFIFICDVRDVSSGVQRVPMHPRSSAGPREPLTRKCEVVVAIFVCVHGRPLQPTNFWKCQCPQSRPIPQQEGLMKQDEAPH